MPKGTYTQKKVPKENLKVVVAGCKAQGAEVKTEPQESENVDFYTVIATFPENT